MGDFATSVVSYRLYCKDCDAEAVVRDRELGETPWSVTSLHFHEARCPACVAGVVDAGDEAGGAVADGGQPTLEAFSEGDADE